MEREHGNKEFPIWLLGDSEPQKWKKVLEFPLDERHPIRHNIWTSVIDPIQDILFRQLKVRINTSEIYIRNAITNPKNKPKQTDKTWVNQHIKEAINIFSNEIQNFQPIIIFCFGSFAYEFCCRSLNVKYQNSIKYWSTQKLGKEFIYKINYFNINQTNAIPLLHRSISGGKFIVSHENFCDKNGNNYFSFVSKNIAEIILKHKEEFNIFYK
jgi:hypothetical protein